MSFKTEKTEMSDKITLTFLTKFIKPYNGDKESLPAFLTNCDNAMSLATEDQQSILCKFIISQLEGKAQVAVSLKKFSEWLDLKAYLRKTFGEKKHATHLLVDLQNCKQESSEDVTKYSMRIEQILTRILSDVQYNNTNSKELPGRLAAMEDLALNTFILGLNTSISNIVRCRNPSTLNEAIQHAIEEEKLFNLRFRAIKFKNKNDYQNNSNSNFQPKSNFNTKYNSNSNFNNNKFNKKFTSNSNSNYFPKNNSNQNQKSCNYCKNIGHTIDQCRKRQFNNSQRQNSVPKPSTSNVVHMLQSGDDIVDHHESLN